MNRAFNLLRCLRGAERRLRPALAAPRRARPARERWIGPLRRFEPLALVPDRLPPGVRYYLPSRALPNSKTATVVAELCAAGVPRGAIWTRDDDRASRAWRLLRGLPFALGLLATLRRRARRMDPVRQQILLGRERYRRFLRRHPGVAPIVLSDVSPELHMLWSAADAEGVPALWWQDDFHHRGPLAQPAAFAAVLNEDGRRAADDAAPGARIYRRPAGGIVPFGRVPRPPRVGVAVNASFAAAPAQRALLRRLREALGADLLDLRVHPNSRLAAGDFPEPWIRLAPRDEPLAGFAGRIDLCVVGNSAVQLRLACAGVPVLHVAGLDADGHDLYGYVRDGLVYGGPEIALEAIDRHYGAPGLPGRLAAAIGLVDEALPGLAALAGTPEMRNHG